MTDIDKSQQADSRMNLSNIKVEKNENINNNNIDFSLSYIKAEFPITPITSCIKEEKIDNAEWNVTPTDNVRRNMMGLATITEEVSPQIDLTPSPHVNTQPGLSYKTENRCQNGNNSTASSCDVRDVKEEQIENEQHLVTASVSGPIDDNANGNTDSIVSIAVDDSQAESAETVQLSFEVSAAAQSDGPVGDPTYETIPLCNIHEVQTDHSEETMTVALSGLTIEVITDTNSGETLPLCNIDEAALIQRKQLSFTSGETGNAYEDLSQSASNLQDALTDNTQETTTASVIGYSKKSLENGHADTSLPYSTVSEQMEKMEKGLPVVTDTPGDHNYSGNYKIAAGFEPAEGYNENENIRAGTSVTPCNIQMEESNNAKNDETVPLLGTHWEPEYRNSLTSPLSNKTQEQTNNTETNMALAVNHTDNAIVNHTDNLHERADKNGNFDVKFDIPVITVEVSPEVDPNNESNSSIMSVDDTASGCSAKSFEGDMEQCHRCSEIFWCADMVKCPEGHFSCPGCLQRLVQQTIVHQREVKLKCLHQDCELEYPRSALERFLPRGSSQELRCPGCQKFGTIVDSDGNVVCQNPDCAKEWCTKCHATLSDHVGKNCNEVTRSPESDIKIRLEAEEEMTQVKIRYCPSCKRGFLNEGCNHMICICGQTMCYICREPDIRYCHFCFHARNPGRDCVICGKCSLWAETDEADSKIINEIRDKALQKLKNMGYSDNFIGARITPVAEKPTTIYNYCHQSSTLSGME